VVDDRVHPLSIAGDGRVPEVTILVEGRPTPLDDFLAGHGLPVVADRVPVVAYGGNRNPGTLALKCRHYGYRSPGTAEVFVALPATLVGADVVAGGLSDQGYLYGDLYVGPEVADVEIDVWVLLVDPDGLRMLHDSEGVRLGAYACAQLEGLRVDGVDHPVSGLAYAGEMPVVVSPEHGMPLAFETVGARRRVFPAYRPIPMLDHAIESLGLTGHVRELTGIGDHPEVGAQAMKFLNGQFWYRRNTGERRVESAELLERVIWEALLATAHPTSTAAELRARGAVLDAEAAYRPPSSFTVGRWW
jgi:hypothetical protein